MIPIQLDLNKLLGFKITGSETGRRPEEVILGAKVGLGKAPAPAPAPAPGPAPAP